jgi:hypothetical protein
MMNFFLVLIIETEVQANDFLINAIPIQVILAHHCRFVLHYLMVIELDSFDKI